MKKAISIVSLLLVCGTASAQSIAPGHSPVPQPYPQSPMVDPMSLGRPDPQLEQIRLELVHVNQLLASGAASASKDTGKFCYFDDKAYSAGSKRGDQVCARGGVRVVAPAGAAGGHVQSDPLRWVPAQQVVN